MKRIINLLITATVISISFSSCTQDKDDDNTPGTLPGTTVKTYSISLGAQASAVAFNIHDVDSNGSYSISYFNAHKSIIDLVYYYAESGSNACCLSSPTNTALLSVSNYSTYINSSDLGSASITELKKVSTLSPAQFDNVINGTEVKNIFIGAGASANQVTNINAGSIVAVKLGTGKYGLIRVNAVNNSGAASDIDLTMKVQE